MDNKRKILSLAIWVSTLLFVLADLIIVFLCYDQLPACIPSHFTFTGLPDAYSTKPGIWLLPVMGAIIYLVLGTLQLLMRVMKRPDELSTEVLAMVSGMIRLLKLLFSVLFLYLTVATLLIAFGRMKGLGVIFTPLFLLSMTAVLVLSIRRVFLKQKLSGKQN